MQNVLANIVSVVAEDVSPFPRPSKPPLFIDPTFSHKYHVVLAALVGLAFFRFMARCLGVFRVESVFPRAPSNYAAH